MSIAALVADTDDPASASQTVRAQLRLRELILSGELPAGKRIAELALVALLAVSRTPIRMALERLQAEGLLDALPSGGFAVKHFSEADIHDAIELRGTLEGLAARLAAERGISTDLLIAAHACLDQIDSLLSQPTLSEESFSGYVTQNGRFHELLALMSGSNVVQRQIQRACTLPFASPNGFVMSRSTGPDARDVLVVAQAQHRGVIDAIVKREGARAEALAREHARIAQRNLGRSLQNQEAMRRLPGASLIRRHASTAK